MHCPHFDAHRCRSCTLMGQPYADQVTTKDAACRAALADHPGIDWLAPVTGPEDGFRNKAKMVVAGTVDDPTIGILDADGHGVDLRDCGVCAPGLRAAFPALARFVTRARLVPYDVPARRGELKYLLVTVSPDEELMVRFVLRSQEAVARIRRHLPSLLAELPAAVVVTANVQPVHQAVLEGDLEILFTDRSTLPMRVDGVTLHLRPQGFFQTNTPIAAALYRQGRQWVGEAAPRTVWDLYSGVGGFALFSAAPGREVLGVESSVQAVEAASLSAAEAGLSGVRFVAGDATAFALAAARPPDLVVVNPPRRGLGADLADWLESSGVRDVVYSSCNVTSLARDLARMPSLRPVTGRLFDMFPQTHHAEVMLRLHRR